MKKRFVFLFLVLILSTNVAFADYLFQVQKNYSDVYVNKDGSITIDYKLTFKCASNGTAIDIVDVGLPNRNYNPADFEAWINGNKLSTIRQSEYVSIGVEIPLGAYTIKQNQTGTLRVRGKVGRMIYEDDDDPNYASVEFMPTWFGSKYTQGTTDLKINMHFPAGVTGNETKYHKIKPEDMRVKKNHIMFTFRFPDHSPSSSEKVGISFPRQYVDVVYKPTFSDRHASFFSGLKNLVFIILFPWVFPVGIFVLIVYFSFRSKRRRMMKYLPPELSVEGVGIKRGLTAPEAAIITETPLNKVLAMILFGLLKKGAVEVRKSKHFRLKRRPLVEKLRPYEISFLDCVKKDGGFSEKRARKFLITFIKQTNRKLKGFSRKETAQYYKRISQQAWDEVKKASTPEVVGTTFSARHQWLMLDKDFSDRMKDSIPHDTVVVPDWYRHTGYSGTSGTNVGSGFSLPDFANSVTNSISNFSSNLVTNVSDFTSTITGRTNPPPVSTSSGGSYSSGGSSCACACACAGCACACAGGGR